MRNFMKLFPAAIMSVAALFMASCGGDDNGGGGSGSFDESELIGKWEFNQANSNGIVSLEFGVSGNYIAVIDQNAIRSEVEPDYYSIFGTYTVVGKRVDMPGFGTVTVVELTEGSVSFSVKLEDSQSTMAVTADKQPEMESSTKTDRLCKTWKITGHSVNGTDVPLITEGDEGDPEFVYFSKAGTYLVSYYDGTTGLANWTWKSEAANTAYYSWDFPAEWSEENVVTFTTLTGTQLVVTEIIDGDVDVYTLEPASPGTKSAAGGKSPIRKHAGKGFM